MFKRDKKALMLKKAPEVADKLKLLSHEGRLKLLCFLSEGELNVSQLQELTELSQSQISQYLKQFELAGVVEHRKEGKWAWYRIVSADFLKLIHSLQNIFCDIGDTNANR